MVNAELLIGIYHNRNFQAYITLGGKYMNESFFEKIEAKTKVNKDTIIGLAKKLQEGNFKNENTLKEII